MTKAEYIQKWDRFQRRYENYYTTQFKKALKIQVQQHLTLGYITPDAIFNVLTDLYKRVGPIWAAATGVARKKPTFLKARMPMGFSERIVELMRQYYGLDLLQDANQITEYTREVIQNIFSEAAITGWSIQEITDQLDASSELGAMRARRIARTETVAAANAAAVINAKETEIPMNKRWLAVNDARTRHSHRNVDDVTIPLADAFTVGGVAMEQPGARKTPDGRTVPASEVVNCRCVLGFVVIKKPR